MNKIQKILLAGMFVPTLLLAQAPSANKAPKKDKQLYTVAYSHLDTEWNWDYRTTIDECIKNVMTENFYLLEKYPEYVFSFTGSRRYQMMKEYYPELYAQVKEYISKGRWFVSGSSVDEGEVNVSSSESLIRQVLYGNQYFKKEFGKESVDYMLPDCFGFLANLPTIWHHCGLLGFSTQKLTWRSAVGVPFNVGVWNGPDGKGIIAALNATSYTSRVEPRLDQSEYWNKRIDENQKNYGFQFDYKYYGVGDMGGAPRENDVKNAVESLHNDDGSIDVLLTSSDQMYKDITPEIKSKLPVYSGDLLLIEHSAGSLTSQAYMKRINRKNELLAKSAEQLAVAANMVNGTAYPTEKINKSWDLVLGSQFHDILPGTSIPKAYEYAWNDEFIAANGFSEVLKNSVNEIVGEMNTQSKGKAVVVYNSVAYEREDIVTATLSFDEVPENIVVYDGNQKPLETQIIGREGNHVTFIFLAKVPSLSLNVFDVRTTKAYENVQGQLKIASRSIENEYYKILFADNGDMLSIRDKIIGKELLVEPAKLEFQHESPKEWPAWNMDWDDRINPPIDFMDDNCQISIMENGPVRVSLKITRSGQNSEITQVVSLSAGESGKRVEVSNDINWQSRGVSLKAAFPLTVSNENATYNLGVGTLERGNNKENQFEVPAKQWFDLTDQSGKYGVTILEDCKYGSDKPADNKLRLTLMYTPETHNWYKVQNSQDWGRHQFRYGIYGHTKDWKEANSAIQGECFNQPLIAFEASSHKGKLGKSFSLMSVKSPAVGVMAVKKMEDSDYYLVRVKEVKGKDHKVASLNFASEIEDAYEVNGQETKIGDASFNNKELSFDLSHYTIKSFAVKLKSERGNTVEYQQSIDLPYNQDVISCDHNRHDGDMTWGWSFPAELITDTVISEGIKFKMGSIEDQKANVVNCRGQELALPKGYNKIYILAAADDVTEATFKLGNKEENLSIQNWTGYIGQHYNRNFAQDGLTVTDVSDAYVKTDNIAWFASHCHQSYPSKNKSYQYCYMYKYALDLPKGIQSIQLPDNPKIKIMAITVSKGEPENAVPLQPIYDDFKKDKAYVIKK
ncbi:alpha-mannosidase [Plebeiibacterium sediminum]|uniref:Glycosyl hydrolase-related protein n=1 Tax=Plebeiibacterium sediminum TaxID=2992112 RepID=A0AAE3SFK1_9BACT|nr:glycoside hydrolase family 38 C-terminal domain-containing protein [Plebeiobacterium sediminum]MCW3786273.1 glycosyl hydrolase-related protein [Plebeiobacterium sediminum]